MSDPNDITQQNGESPFEPERLLKDLRSLPKVQAPMDFTYHLSQSIEQLESKERVAWWKRPFLPAVEGGFRIPALAYGAVAVMVVLFFSVYVFNVTDFERDMKQEMERGTEDRMVAPDEQRTPSDVSDQKFKSKEAETGKRDMTPSVSRERQTTPDAGTDAATDVPTGRTTAVPAEPARQDMFRKSEQTPATLPAAAPAKPQSLDAVEEEFRVRGFLETDKDLRILDSLAGDSLRKLDSLRRLRSAPATPPPSGNR